MVASRHRRGFTLIEIMVVLAIAVILTKIVYSNYSNAKQEARDDERVSDITQLQTALESYFQDSLTLVGNDMNQYPPTYASFPVSLPCQAWLSTCLSSNASCGTGLACLATTTVATNQSQIYVPYISTVPTDPQTKAAYSYYACNSSASGCVDTQNNGLNQAYCLGAKLENPADDAEAQASAQASCAGTYVNGTSWCPLLASSTINYVVCRQ